jgi:hypothetical protein
MVWFITIPSCVLRLFVSTRAACWLPLGAGRVLADKGREGDTKARYWRRPWFVSSAVVHTRSGGLPAQGWPMRGDIDATTVRCLSGCAAQPSGFLRYQGEAVNAALVQILRA